jgi:agmatinase
MQQNTEIPRSKQEKIAAFDPSGVGNVQGEIFGLPFSLAEAEVVLIPVPWEVTVSYSAGTAGGPEAIRQASYQLDLFDPAIENAWQLGIAMEPIGQEWEKISRELRHKTGTYISWLEGGGAELSEQTSQSLLADVDGKSEELLLWLKAKCQARNCCNGSKPNARLIYQQGSW